MSLAIAPTPEEAAVLEKFGFKLETAYIELPRCSRCKFWSRESAPNDTLGSCEIGQPHAPVDDGEEVKIWTWCGENTIATSEDFGCVQFKERGNNQT